MYTFRNAVADSTWIYSKSCDEISIRKILLSNPEKNDVLSILV